MRGIEKNNKPFRYSQIGPRINMEFETVEKSEKSMGE